MSVFTEWLSKEMSNVESGVMAFVTALAPDLKTIALTAITSGISAYTSTTGTSGDRFVAARNAVESVAKSAATPLATDALHVGVVLAIAANPTLLSTPAAAVP